MSSDHRARTRAIRAEMATSGESYSRAARIAPDRELDLLGRLLLAVQRGTDLRDLLRWMDFWSTGRPGGGYVLEWRDGPYADELHDELIAQLVASGSRLLRPADVRLRTDIPNADRRHRLFLLIRDVPVEFRSCEPVGLDQAWENQAQRLRRLLDPAGADSR